VRVVRRPSDVAVTSAFVTSGGTRMGTATRPRASAATGPNTAPPTCTSTEAAGSVSILRVVCPISGIRSTAASGPAGLGCQKRKSATPG
jgi:hypothetical protein